MVKSTPKTFSTFDLYLSAFLDLHGAKTKLELKNGKVTFNFTVSDELYLLMAKYNGNAEVGVADFSTAIKRLRSQLLTLRDGGQR